MDSDASPTTYRCKKLSELPLVIAEWQQTAWCPDCEYYSDGQCGNPTRRSDHAACPLDGPVLRLREVEVDAPGEQMSARLEEGPGEVDGSPVRSETLEQAIDVAIRTKTSGRIQALAITRTGGELVIRGVAPCFHVKQLALHAAQNVLQSTGAIAQGLNLAFDVLISGRKACRPESSPRGE